ncbi:MAG: AraC family transcriptional regulator [Lachnospiraceae bacterium]|nr:AraC family transcriptional regulator [Lachnospiraceae bacterium]
MKHQHRLLTPLILPVCDFFTVAHAISFLYYCTTGKEADGQALLHINVAEKPTMPEANQELQNYMLEEAENEQVRYGYDIEKQKMQAVKDGDVEMIRQEITPDVIRQSQQMLNKMSRMPKKQWEYSVVSSIVLSCRAAIAGGLPVKISYSLSDTLLQRLTHCNSFQDMLLLESEVRMTFAAAVNEYKTKSTNISCVEKAKNYIHDHLNRSFTLDELAETCEVSKSHLCRKFKAATNQTIMEYLYANRVKVAQDLLRYSNKPISYIAEYLRFSSQSHFTDIFRKYTGQTPLQYRNRTE